MSKISKKVLSLVLALVLSLSVCLIAFAEPAFDFSIKEDDTGSITGCDGDIEDGVLELIDWDDFYELDLMLVWFGMSMTGTCSPKPYSSQCIASPPKGMFMASLLVQGART